MLNIAFKPRVKSPNKANADQRNGDFNLNKTTTLILIKTFVDVYGSLKWVKGVK